MKKKDQLNLMRLAREAYEILGKKLITCKTKWSYTWIIFDNRF